MSYDSTQDTKKHIVTVGKYIVYFQRALEERFSSHDLSKLQEPEKSMYDKYKPLIRQAEIEFGYGSKEYEGVLKKMGEALQHHFKANSHHPEYYPNGINGMNLIDIVEMLCDWKAASEQYGTPLNLEANRKRFKISDQLFEILQNTVKELGW